MSLHVSFFIIVQVFESSLEDISTSLPQTTGSVRNIGEVIGYDYTLRLPEGHMNLTMAISLSSSMMIINATVISVGPQITVSNTSVVVTSFATADIDFGPTVNVPDNEETAGDLIVIRVCLLFWLFIHSVVLWLPRRYFSE
jgi:hypothetical protein